MKNIIVIHGVGGLEREVYFSHLADTCKELGLEVIIPSLGSYRQGTTYSLWKEYFDKFLKDKIDKDTIIVAQSIGTQFAVKYLSEKKIKIGAYISTAGPFDVLSYREEQKEPARRFENTAITFKPTIDEFNSFRELDFPKFSLYCDNDIFFEQENLENYARAINSKPVFVKGKAHFGVPEVKELEDLIKELVLM